MEAASKGVQAMRVGWTRTALPLCLAISLVIPGCWNYKEVEDMAIVAGVAVDKTKEEDRLRMTVELVDTSGALSDTQAGFQISTLTGGTMFEIVRNMISLTGKRLFWSHAKVLILSEELAREGLVKVLDWYNRDTETRSDVYIFVSDAPTAGEILEMNSVLQKIMSFELEQLMRDETHSSTAPIVEIWDFIDRIESKGKYAIAPLVGVQTREGGKKSERVMGTAVFSGDRMIGKLSGEESKYMMFSNNNIKGGVLAVKDKAGRPRYSLEIYSNQTRMKPSFKNGKLRMDISTVTRTGLDEVMAKGSVESAEDIRDIKALAEEQLKEGIEKVIDKAQHEYHADIFGYGEVVHQDMKDVWKKIEDNWEEEFTDMDVSVKSEIVIESTAKTTRSIRVGQ